ncbi:MAG: DUF4437 domain-containing protein [Gammaproteobacteria bacterium]|nr:DUF4437 domain-containing protein [Gammaproteobacteria bacterium]
MSNVINKLVRSGFLLSLVVVAACASAPTRTPYPAFVQVDALPNVFMVGLPGIRAKQLAGSSGDSANSNSRRSSSRLQLPPQWQFGTGAAPDKSVEIYVLAGEIQLGEFDLGAGGYAYIPPGSTGMRLQTEGGASLLYFLDDANPASVIQTPMILSRRQLNWQPISADPNDVGVSRKELRFDPGSGARTELVRIEAGATRPWMRSSVQEEGYLLEGSYQHSECVDGEIVSDRYLPGGYYFRPAGVINGSPSGDGAAVWLVRTLRLGSTTVVDACVAANTAGQ